MLSLDPLASSVNPGSATTHLCRSVKRTPSGSTSGCASIKGQRDVLGVLPLHGRFSIFARLAFGGGSPYFGISTYNVSFDHRLTPEPRVEGQPFRGVQTVFLVLLHGGQVLLALSHDDVAGGAGAAPAAVVLEVDVVGQRDVQQRTRPAVIGQRVLAVVHLDGPVEGQKGDLVNRHHEFSSSRSARFEVTASLIADSMSRSASGAVTWLSAVVSSRI